MSSSFHINWWHWFSGCFSPFHSQEWSISNFPCSLARNITSHSLKNLAFHTLLRLRDNYTIILLPILTTSLKYVSLYKVRKTFASLTLEVKVRKQWWTTYFWRWNPRNPLILGRLWSISSFVFVSFGFDLEPGNIEFILEVVQRCRTILTGGRWQIGYQVRDLTWEFWQSIKQQAVNDARSV